MTRKIARRPDVQSRDIDEEAVLVPVRRSARDPLTVHTLNPVGRFVWEQLRSPISVDDLATLVAEHFEVEADEAARDLSIFVAELRQAGLLEEAP